MSSELSGALFSLNIGNNELKNEKETTSNDTDINTATKCAACGKEGDGDSMNTCNKCDLVQYCNAACKKKHRKTHKKKCEKRAAELYDEKLFNKEPPPPEECPICFLPLSYESRTTSFQVCCGKNICIGCILAMIESEGDDSLCAFCRTPDPNSDEEEVKRVMKLIEKGDPVALNWLAGCYEKGTMGMLQDRAKAKELYLKAGELGFAPAYYNLGLAYVNGYGVEIDMKKAKHYYELAAMNGNLLARNNLGCVEADAGNQQRAHKHFMIGAMAGHKRALAAVKEGFMEGRVTKDEYANALRAYHKSQDDIKSDARDRARAIREQMMNMG